MPSPGGPTRLRYQGYAQVDEPEKLRQQIAELEQEVAELTRAVISVLTTVTVLPAGRGKKVFDPERVRTPEIESAC